MCYLIWWPHHQTGEEQESSSCYCLLKDPNMKLMGVPLVFKNKHTLHFSRCHPRGHTVNAMNHKETYASATNKKDKTLSNQATDAQMREIKDVPTDL